MSKKPSRPNWKEAVVAHTRAAIKRPKDGMTLQEVAAEMGLSEDKARDALNKLIRSGWAERIQDKTVNAAGAVIPCSYYKLLRDG